MKLNRVMIRKMILEALGDKSQRFREPGIDNIASVRLPEPAVIAAPEDEDLTDFYHDLLQMYIRAGNLDDAEKLKAKMLRMAMIPPQGV